MSEEFQEKVRIPNGDTRQIPRQPDGDRFQICCSGGIRAIQQDKDRWLIAPIFDAGPCAKGYLSKLQLQEVLRTNNITEIAFHREGWFNGQCHSSWSPILPGRTNHMIAPADIWRQIAVNLAHARTVPKIGTVTTKRELAALIDDHDQTERLAQSISLSLRNMDISIEHIFEFYYEQIVALMASDRLDGTRQSSTLDQTLYAQVHAFFAHLGAARDYLATLIGFRLNKNSQKTDSLARLIEVIRLDELGNDALLDTLVERGYIQRRPSGINKIQISGWIADVTMLRNLLMHKRPYGSRFAERMGYAVAIDRSEGIFRYTRPITLNDGEHDVLDIVVNHYRKAGSLFVECAEKTGLDTNILKITDADIVEPVARRAD